jgi:transcriptional regulator with XRE-family HTH domain
MAEKFKTLLERMSPERQARIKARAQEEIARMALQELRQAKNHTQAQIAQLLGIQQAGVSRIESQTDIYVSTLRRFIEAMGGELQIVASFPDGRIQIDQFAKVDEKTDSTTVAQ